MIALTKRFISLSVWLLALSAHGGQELVVESDVSRFSIPLDQFAIAIDWTGTRSVPLFVTISQDSLTWRHFADGNKLPQLLLSITMQGGQDIHFVYRQQAYLPERQAQDDHHVFIHVDVFAAAAVAIMHNDKVIGHIRVQPDPSYFRHRYLYIHHSCSPYGIQLDHTADLFTSMSCHFYPGPRRRGILDISYMPAEGRLADQSSPPYQLQLTGQGRANFRLWRRDEPYQVQVQGQVPEYVARFKTALGFGPYRFQTESPKGTEPLHEVATYMLYGRYDLSATSSLRFFDAYLSSGAMFNNLGAYFAYELGSTADKRISVVPLLGVQAISFRPGAEDATFHQAIYPQGGEIVYRHAFGLQNYSLIYGMFVSTYHKVGYENIWLRFGRRIFWEINWIGWRYQDREAAMYGLSVGIPFLSL
jgi:hypothetical protein